MKTVAIAALLLMLSTPTWSDQPEANEPASSNEPIVLSEAEMDIVTAGGRVFFNYDHFHNSVVDTNGDPNIFTFGMERTF